MIKICQNCNKSFNGRSRSKFCSLKCRDEFKKKQNLLKPKNNVHKIKQNDIKKICPSCNKEFIAKRKEQIYCSVKCSKPRKNEYYNCKCKFCNKEFESRRKTDFCNIDCRKKYNKKYNKEHYTKICKYCKKEYISKNENFEFCSRQCSIEYNKIKKYKKVCLHCGKTFMTKYNDKKCCSSFCSHAYIAKIKHINNTSIEYSKGKWCKYKNLKLRSTYELRSAYILDIMMKNNIIKNWSYCKDIIRYTRDDNKIHNYFVDFTIYLNNNTKCYLEVKGYETELDNIKWNAARQQGYNLIVWKIENIEQYENKFKITKDFIKKFVKSSLLKIKGDD